MNTHVVGILDSVSSHSDAIRKRLEEVLSDVALDIRVEGDDGNRKEILEVADIILTFHLDSADLEDASSLRWVQILSAGYDSKPLDALAEAEIILTNASGVHAEQISQQVLGYLLVFARNIHEGIRQQHAGEWESYHGGELGDHSLGIIGVGAIGTRIGEYAATFGMDVIGCKRTPSTAPEFLEKCVTPNNLDELLRECTYVVIACPLTDETRQMVGEHEFDIMREETVVVNIARGQIIDESALIGALETNSIRGAALDVFETEPLPPDSPLREMHNVIMTPHMAGSSPHYYVRAADIFAENMRAFASGDFDLMPTRIM